MSERLLVVGNLAKDVMDGREQFGGSAANLALGAKRMGLGVGIMSVLGRDPFSKSYREFLGDNGIDISLTPDTLEELPVCQVVSRQNMIASSIWNDNGCHPAMDAMKVVPPMFEGYGLVHLVSCPPKLARNIALTKVQLSFEPGPMLVEDSAYFDKEVARLSTLMFMNEEEFAAAKKNLEEGFENQDEYHKLLALVVTLGKQGVKLFKQTSGNTIELNIPTPCPHSEIVDPTGAGDNFKAGFLSGYIRGRSLEECVQIGSEMGAACVMQKGGILSDEVVGVIKNKFKL